jgi:hypothetical protein
MDNDDHSQTQLGENLRFYGDMRFKQLTLLMAAMTALGAGIAQYANLRGALAAVGMFFVGVMWVMEVRSTLYFNATREVAPQLWPRPPRAALHWLSATNAVLILHAAFYGLWLWCVAQWLSDVVLEVLGAALGVLFLVFTVTSY